jgi:serine/threonine protein phosphatase 1
MIDRGMESKEVLDTIFLLLEHDFNVISIKGNHEQMLLDSIDDSSQKINWILNGGKETLSSFLTSRIEKIPSKYIDYLKSLNNYHIIDKYILVHAGINMKIRNPFEDEKSLLWLRDWEKQYDENWLKNRYVIHGHTPTTKQEIIKRVDDKERVLCIDNGSYINKEGYGGICVLKLNDLSLHFEY